MTIRKLGRALVCGIVLTAFPGGLLRAEQPAKEPATILVSKFPYPLLIDYAAFVTDSNSGSLSLVTATYGNALGVEIVDVDAALRTQLGLEKGTGVVVTSVNKESEAAKAGLAPYDLVLKAGEKAIGSPKQFHELIENQQGKEVTFQILRKGKPASVTITLPKTPVYELTDRKLGAALAGVRLQFPVAGEPVKAEQYYRIGVQLADADDTLRSQLRLAVGEGLVVTDVVADSPAAKAGIQKNDVLTKLEGKRLTKIDAVNTQIQEIKERKVSVAFFRGGTEMTGDVTPRLASEPGLRLSLVGELDGLILTQAAEHAVRFVLEVQPEAQAPTASRPSAAEQIVILKNQLGEMQKSLAALEAALKAAPADKAPEEKK